MFQRNWIGEWYALLPLQRDYFVTLCISVNWGYIIGLIRNTPEIFVPPIPYWSVPAFEQNFSLGITNWVCFCEYFFKGRIFQIRNYFFLFYLRETLTVENKSKVGSWCSSHFDFPGETPRTTASDGCSRGQTNKFIILALNLVLACLLAGNDTLKANDRNTIQNVVTQ